MKDTLLEWLKPSDPIKDIKGVQGELGLNENVERRRISSNIDLVIVWELRGVSRWIREQWYENRWTHKRLSI